MSWIGALESDFECTARIHINKRKPARRGYEQACGPNKLSILANDLT